MGRRAGWIAALVASLVVTGGFSIAAAASGGNPPGPADTTPGVAAPVDPVAPAVPAPVVRHGQRPPKNLGAGRGGFTAVAPVRFPDGVAVTVVKVSRSVEQGSGPGVFQGRPHTAVTLSLSNGSAKPIDLTQVVVTTTYGSPSRQAAAVYNDPLAADFASTVAPGGVATATYVFSIPAGRAQSAVMTVDFDDAHSSATFAGLAQ